MSRSAGSLGARLSWWLAAVALFGLCLVSCLVYALTWQNLRTQRTELLANKLAMVEHFVIEADLSGDLHQLRHKLDDFLASHKDMGLRITDGSQALLFGNSPKPPSERAAQGEAVQDKSFEKAAQPVEAVSRVATSSTIAGPVAVVLTLDPSADTRFLSQLRWTLVLASVLGTAVTSAGGIILVRLGLAPVRSLAAQADALDVPSLGQRLDGVGQPLELQPLVDRFNSLLDRLERAYMQLEAFNADVAHELFTPLTSIRAATEVALRKPYAAADLHSVLSSNLEDIQQLSSIVEDMLFLSHVDRGATARGAAVISLAEVAREVTDYHDASAAESGLRLEVRGDVSGAWDVGLLKRALSNLIANATRHAEPASTVRVELSAQADFAAVRVINRGPAIDAEHVPRIFDRFFRADTARGDARSHHGLGLAIVAAIARMHGGRTTVHCEGGETSIGILLPLASADGERSLA